MKMNKLWAVPLLAITLLSCVEAVHTRPFEDKYNDLEAPIEVQNEYLSVLEKLGTFQSSVTPSHTPSSWAYEGISCSLTSTLPADEGWALYLETAKGCPYTVHLSIKFGYNIFRGEVTSDFRTYFQPPREQSAMAFDLSGKGNFKFAHKDDGTQVDGDYSMSGQISVGEKTYSLDFSNEVHALEANGELVTGQTYSTLALGTDGWQMGARSLVGHSYGEQTERHQLNKEVVPSKLSEQIFSQLSVFSPKSISTIGRQYVESQ